MPNSDRKECCGVKLTFYMMSNIGRTSYSAMKANFLFPFAETQKLYNGHMEEVQS